MKKRHHFRPVLHLKHFAGSDGLIWVFDKSGQAPLFAQKPENIGFEKGLYKVEAGPDEASDEFEDWLAENVDRPAARPLAKASVGESLTDEERLFLATFFVAQDLRIPPTRDHLTDRFAGDRNDLWQRWRVDPSALAVEIFHDTGKRYTPAELLKNIQAYEAAPGNTLWLGFVRFAVQKAAKLLVGMSWNLGRAPEHMSFVTTDIGIAKGIGDPTNLVSWGPGFEGGRNNWVIPLTPQSALILEPSGTGMIGQLKESWVSEVNERLKADALRWIYSRDRPPLLARRVERVK